MSEATTHIFFGLHGTLSDPRRLAATYDHACGVFMARHYGGAPAMWATASQRIRADWDSYYADLNLDGDDALAHLREGRFRTTRALFRLVGMDAPDIDATHRLAHDLACHTFAAGDMFYPAARTLITELNDTDNVLGVVTHLPEDQARALLCGAGMCAYFKGAIVGRCQRDTAFLRHLPVIAHTPATDCIVVDADARIIEAARQTGMRGIHIAHPGEQLPALARQINRLGSLSRR
jgi:FMN phosphatase YigB (HAD superfamily)